MFYRNSHCCNRNMLKLKTITFHLNNRPLLSRGFGMYLRTPRFLLILPFFRSESAKRLLMYLIAGKWITRGRSCSLKTDSILAWRVFSPLVYCSMHRRVPPPGFTLKTRFLVCRMLFPLLE